MIASVSGTEKAETSTYGGETRFEPAMEVDIQPYVTELSLSDTVSVLELGSDRCHNIEYNSVPIPIEITGIGAYLPWGTEPR